jgi:hypothetical protein
MTTDNPNKCDPIKQRGNSAYTVFTVAILLFIMCVFESGYIKYVWFGPNQTIDLFFKICVQGVVLMPALAGLMARAKMGKKLKAGEISPAYAADLSSWLVGQLVGVYLAFMLLVGLLRY